MPEIDTITCQVTSSMGSSSKAVEMTGPGSVARLQDHGHFDCRDGSISSSAISIREIEHSDVINVERLGLGGQEKSMPVIMGSGSTVGQLKNCISGQAKINASDMRLISNGHHLKDNGQTLGHYGVSRNSHVRCGVGNLRRGRPTAAW